MRPFAVGLLLAASTCFAQQAAPNLPQSQAQNQAQAAAGVPNGTMTIPAGTQMALTLASPITDKARKGDSVRAAVAFPVTVGSQVAIPVGAYVQGVLTQIVKHSRSGPSVKMQFSTLVFANGYTVTLNGGNLQAKWIEAPDSAAPRAAATAGAPTVGGGTYGLAALSGATSDPDTAEDSSTVASGYALVGGAARAPQQAPVVPPPLTPPPAPGPNKGLIIGLSVGGTAAVVLSAIVFGHRGGSGPGGSVLFDTGWQFNLVLNTPLTLSAARATAAP